jgi:hypothetical protein
MPEKLAKSWSISWSIQLFLCRYDFLIVPLIRVRTPSKGQAERADIVLCRSVAIGPVPVFLPERGVRHCKEAGQSNEAEPPFAACDFACSARRKMLLACYS